RMGWAADFRSATQPLLTARETSSLLVAGVTAAGRGDECPVRRAERWMVEGSFFPCHPTIGQRVLEEVHQGRLVVGFEVELLHALGRVGEVAAAAVEVDDRGQVLLTAVVHMWRPQPDVAEAGRLEGAVVYRRAALRERRAVGAQASPARVFRGRTDPDVVEALIAAVLVDGAVLVEEADRRVGQLGSGRSEERRVGKECRCGGGRRGCCT